MKKYLLIIILFLAACSNEDANLDLNKKLLGVWGNSDDNGQTFWGFDEFFENGVTKSWGELPENKVPYKFEGTYTINNKKNEICFTVVKNFDSDILLVGESFCDKIIDVTEKVFVYIGPDGAKNTLYKQDFK